jgi:hypothetical protein
MSKVTYVNGTTGVLADDGPALLLSVCITPSEPPVNSQIDFHNVGAVADLAAGNKVFSMNVGAQTTAINHQFDGAVFPKGLVIKASGAVHIVVETA